MLPAEGSAQHERVTPLLQLERQLFSVWFRWLTSSQSDGAQRYNFQSLMAEVDRELAEGGGPYFLGIEPSLVDCMFAPFLERMAASVPYYKGIVVRNNPEWPSVRRWFDAMEELPSYRHIRSDFYTHVNDLPPQIGRCQSTAEAREYAAEVDGDGDAWRLPLVVGGTELEPTDHLGQTEEESRREAAERILANHEAIVRFSARGAGRPGFPPVSAELSDPNASISEAALPAVDAAIRHTVDALLEGPEVAEARLSEGLDSRTVTVCLGYLRDRISVPRDMGYPAARQCRAHLNWAIEAIGQKS
jgi:glutathione S-transferase